MTTLTGATKVDQASARRQASLLRHSRGTFPASGPGRFALACLGWTVLIAMTAPLAVIVLMSFSSGNGLQFPPPGYSMRWYRALFDDPQWRLAVQNSLSVGLMASAAALVLGCLTAYGLARGKFRGKAALHATFLAPMILPAIITAVAMYLQFVSVGAYGTLFGLVIAHLTLIVPYVVLVMATAFQSIDVRLEQVAASLGARWTRVMRTVVVAITLPSLLAAWLLAFAMSFDEVIVTIFISGRYVTVPKLMFSELRDQVDPTVTALSTLLIAFTLVVVGVVAILASIGSRRGMKLVRTPSSAAEPPTTD